MPSSGGSGGGPPVPLAGRPRPRGRSTAGPARAEGRSPPTSSGRVLRRRLPDRISPPPLAADTGPAVHRRAGRRRGGGRVGGEYPHVCPCAFVASLGRPAMPGMAPTGRASIGPRTAPVRARILLRRKPRPNPASALRPGSANRFDASRLATRTRRPSAESKEPEEPRAGRFDHGGGPPERTGGRRVPDAGGWDAGSASYPLRVCLCGTTLQRTDAAWPAREMTLHRHLDHRRLTLAAIDDGISRSRGKDWSDLRRAAFRDESPLDKIGRIYRCRAADHRAQRRHFWLHHVEAHRPAP